ncbi:class I SAM-dependent methyltransferase [Moheibacter sediminis]|uniref:Methyltransferase domain-containing protein n=1 Tax=Moheibacter sediminis TaxID=1434700 RepID=A0A1W2ALN3_9FLAO|nr:class I SAM-dependent methyltransferase [Moheibacter sediminis]SMC61422.1 Methyltransferase domain-containing protein [Moheibacter sediminis]
MKQCRICGNEKNLHPYNVREMMFGMRDEFLYFQCPECECLQIEEIPNNLSDYYPQNYYSFNVKTAQSGKQNLKEALTHKRNEYAVFKNSLWGYFLNKIYPTDIFKPLNIAALNKNMSILDIGCGNGKLLFSLKEMGCKNLTGIDPYLKDDIITPNVKIYKKNIEELTGKWDFIMLNHSFEHMENPLTVFKKINDILNDNGTCMIRIPTSSSDAWEKYRENWVQLDAPRHIFLHSRKSMELLSKQAGLEIFNVFYDSGAFQFWGSEQYQKNIPLVSDDSYSFKKDESVFTIQQIKNFNQKSIELNKTERGDMCAFYLRKSK